MKHKPFKIVAVFDDGTRCVYDGVVGVTEHGTGCFRYAVDFADGRWIYCQEWHAY